MIIHVEGPGHDAALPALAATIKHRAPGKPVVAGILIAATPPVVGLTRVVAANYRIWGADRAPCRYC